MPLTLRRARPLSLLLVASAAVALPACGGDDDGGSTTGGASSGGDDREAISALVTGYTNAFADGDFEKACGYLAEGARKEIERAAEQVDADGCADALDKVTDGLDDKTRESLRGIEVTSVEIDGDEAVVKTKLTGSDEQTDPATVVREDGEWRIAPTSQQDVATATAPTATAPESP